MKRLIDLLAPLGALVIIGSQAWSMAGRALPGSGPVSRWERLPPSTVTPEEQQQAMAAAAREAWARPLECR